MKSESTSFKTINRLAIPAIIAGISEPLITLADTAIIGHLGTIPLAAVGIASSFFLLIIWTLSQTKSAISAIVSQSLGKKSLSALSSFVPQAITINVAFGIGIYFITGIFSESIFKFYNASGELLTLTQQYYDIRSIGYPFTLATYAIFGVLRGVQNTKWAMEISIIGGLVNLILDLILVYGVEGLVRPMGVEGAALASLTAQIVMLMLALHRMIKSSGIDIEISLKPHSVLGKFSVMSLNLFIRTVALNIVYFLGVQYSTGINESNAAAHTVAINIWLFSSFLIDGYSNAGNAISGKLIGAGDIIGLNALTKKLLKTNVIIASVLGLVYVISYPVMGRFFSSDEEVIVLFNSIFWLVILCQPINAIAFTYDGIYKGLGKTALLRNTLLISTFIGFVPLLLILGELYESLLIVWVSFLIWMIFRGGLLHFNFVRKYRTRTTV